MKSISRTEDSLVPCPDCGERFHPRGLASHRRHRHAGLAKLMSVDEPATPAETPREDAAPARDEAPRAAEADPEVLGLLRELRSGMHELQVRLDGMERLLGSRADEVPTEGDSLSDEEQQRLRAELDAVLEEIDAEKSKLAEYERVAGEQAAACDARHAFHRTLGRLRRRQFGILFRMGAHAPGVRRGADAAAFGF